MTHSLPDNLATVIELPQAVKRYLGLDGDRSWIVIDEVNEFTWPGFDLRPVPRSRDTFSYGFLPPCLFNALMAKFIEFWTEGQGKATSRDLGENSRLVSKSFPRCPQGQTSGEGKALRVSPQTPRIPQADGSPRITGPAPSSPPGATEGA